MTAVIASINMALLCMEYCGSGAKFWPLYHNYSTKIFIQYHIFIAKYPQKDGY